MTADEIRKNEEWWHTSGTRAITIEIAAQLAELNQTMETIAYFLKQLGSE